MTRPLRHLDAWLTTEPDPHRECSGRCPDCGSCFDCDPCVCPLYADEDYVQAEVETARLMVRETVINDFDLMDSVGQCMPGLWVPKATIARLLHLVPTRNGDQP